MTEPADSGRVLREFSVSDHKTARRSRRYRWTSEERIGGVVAPNWKLVAGHLAPKPGLGDRHSRGSLGEMTWRRYHDGRGRAWRRMPFGRVRLRLRSEETDVPDFRVSNGPRGASRVHGRKEREWLW
jgi:hypothetical protein